MTRYHLVIENGVRTWIAEETLEAVHFDSTIRHRTWLMRKG